ncbi:SapC family protein [Massilia sp. PAMC28688]|uniref:SapC family protein n=1 Tax=Massilia sp. PAMC28688 TaxID=2861283 RepID=UPI001C63996E|nr:SapC family protein [Massilia sp. PAMC28688]QYF92924.1 SapC family protein [Massilia sp. PAMC28688]
MATSNFFQKPVPLNREHHRGIKLDGSVANFSFAASTSSMMIAAAELEEAALTYPVVFVGADGSPTALTALMGINQDENLFVNDGRWEEGCYLPVFVRRYPFVFAEGGPDEQLTVCVDEAHPGLNKETGELLLTDKGEPTEFMQSAIDFLGNCHSEMDRTKMFAQRMHELGLLVERNIEITRDGANFRLEGFFVIDREKLAAVDDTVALELFRTGAMGLISAHLVSLNNVNRLAYRLDRRLAAQAAAAPASAA